MRCNLISNQVQPMISEFPFPNIIFRFCRQDLAVVVLVEKTSSRMVFMLSKALTEKPLGHPHTTHTHSNPLAHHAHTRMHKHTHKHKHTRTNTYAHLFLPTSYLSLTLEIFSHFLSLNYFSLTSLSL